jgi:hypothetical protein
MNSNLSHLKPPDQGEQDACPDPFETAAAVSIAANV